MAEETEGREKPAALRLLRGVARELRDLALDTARCGESLSQDAASGTRNEVISLLQKFDMFSQSLLAHAVLIDDLSGHLEADAGADDVTALQEIIGQVPFFRTRERLKAKLAGAGYEAVGNSEAPDEDHWF